MTPCKSMPKSGTMILMKISLYIAVHVGELVSTLVADIAVFCCKAAFYNTDI